MLLLGMTEYVKKFFVTLITIINILNNDDISVIPMIQSRVILLPETIKATYFTSFLQL